MPVYRRLGLTETETHEAENETHDIELDRLRDQIPVVDSILGFLYNYIYFLFFVYFAVAIVLTGNSAGTLVVQVVGRRGGSVGRASDSRSKDQRFESRLRQESKKK